MALLLGGCREAEPPSQNNPPTFLPPARKEGGGGGTNIYHTHLCPSPTATQLGSGGHTTHTHTHASTCKGHTVEGERCCMDRDGRREMVDCFRFRQCGLVTTYVFS